jgi:hypothetical protein
MRKATFNLLMSVCLPVDMEKVGLYWTDFHKIWSLRIFRKSVEKIQIWLKSENKNERFVQRCMCNYENIWIIISS